VWRYSIVASLHETIGSLRPPIERAKYDRSLAAVHAALSEEAFAAAWSAGRAMTLEQAIADALREGG